MNLLQLRTEALNHGFDSNQYGSRINQWINDAYGMVCRRVNFYAEEATQPIATVTGTASYSWPADFGRARSVYDSDLNRPLSSVSLLQIDASSLTQGTPLFYAMDALNLHLYPTPDGIHNLVLRYWRTPAGLAADSDIPVLPADWHRVLWYWAVKEAYGADDDPQSAQYWEGQFNTAVAELEADVRFPDVNFPSRASSMWGEDDVPLGGSNSWSLYLG